MNKIKIGTDSACDIPVESEQQYGIRVFPFAIAVDDKSYTERVDFTPYEFYDLLKECKKIPATSQYTHIQFLEGFEEIYKEGYSDFIYVAINSKGSNTYNNSLMARDQFYEAHPEAKETFKIHCLDSRSYCLGYGYPVLQAAKKAQKGASVTEILDYLQNWLKCSRIYFASYTLEFAKKSGRISCAAAFVGELMGLKPMITFEDGVSKILDKVRGEKNIVPTLVKLATENMIPKTHYAIVTGSVKEHGEELAAEMEKALGYPPSLVAPAGAAISVNAGPDVIAVIVKDKNKI